MFNWFNWFRENQFPKINSNTIKPVNRTDRLIRMTFDIRANRRFFRRKINNRPARNREPETIPNADRLMNPHRCSCMKITCKTHSFIRKLNKRKSTPTQIRLYLLFELFFNVCLVCLSNKIFLLTENLSCHYHDSQAIVNNAWKFSMPIIYWIFSTIWEIFEVTMYIFRLIFHKMPITLFSSCRSYDSLLNFYNFNIIGLKNLCGISFNNFRQGC